MKFVPLDRDFVVLDPTSSYGPEALLAYRSFSVRGRKWPSLLKRQRVVILADAASGKTAEFREQAEALRRAGRLGIYIPIERLAADGFIGSLSRSDRLSFDQWRRGGDPGWFFLDSIDEARLHHRDIEVALAKFERDLAEAYPRASVLLSCRGTVWNGEDDFELIDRYLPQVSNGQSAEAPQYDPDELLRKQERVQSPKPMPDTEGSEDSILVVALAPLSRDQRLAFLAAGQVTDTDAFENALYRRGLEGLAERPGDLRDLLRYWNRRGDLGDLSEMVEFGIEERLAEEDHGRVGISPAEARHGAERLAAALSLAQETELVLPEFAEPDTGGIDPYLVLGDWKPDDVTGLIQGGVFAPASAGRIRFYHRSAQEYLTASWFRRLGLNDAELYRILLAAPFGVKTLPPSLKAAAAWIAGDHAGLRQHILEREPQLLLAEGDPRRLSLEERSRLLVNFAQAQLAGDNSYRLMDHRALWMFADEGLDTAIREALAINQRADFRLEMLRLIEEGRITACADILLESALDRSAGDWQRLVAIRALADFGDLDLLEKIAADVCGGPPLSATLAPWTAISLFPAALDVHQLLGLIGGSTPAREYRVEGFREELLTLYQSCPTDDHRLAFIDGLARLAFEPPREEWPRISKRHSTLVACFGPTARAAIRDARRTGIRPELLNFLRATQRVADDLREEETAIAELVHEWPELNEALFWAEALASGSDGKLVTRFHEVSPDGPPFWRLSEADRPWLVGALGSDDPGRRLLAVDGLIILAFAGDSAKHELEALRDSVASDLPLLERVNDALAPREPTAADIRRSERWALIEAAREARESETQAGWRRLRDRLQAEPQKLSNPALLAEWPGPLPLLHLTSWLGERVSGGRAAAALHSELIHRAYGPEVAAEYERGLRTIWRVTEPERPEVDDEGRTTTKYVIILSMAGLAFEAAGDPNWARKLDDQQARRAALHVCLDDQGVPQWLGDLLADHPAMVAPLIAEEIEAEWLSPRPYAPFLERAAHSLSPIAPLQECLIRLLTSVEPGDPVRWSAASNLILRFDLSDRERAGLIEKTRARLTAARAGDDQQAISVQIRMLFRLDPAGAADELIAIIEEALSAGNDQKVDSLLQGSFHRHRDPAIDAGLLSAQQLRRLLGIAYLIRGRGTPPTAVTGTDDEDHPARDAFDDPRNELLSALVRSADPEAYGCMLALSDDPAVGQSRHRLRELAREIAERCAERAPWSEQQVIRFEQEKMAPVTTGNDLLDLACDLLDRISWEFVNEDMTARSVVQPASSEKQVQEWLGAELRLRSGNRFTVDREKVVASNNRPDLALVAAAAPVEVAIEIKHAEKGWSLPQLRHALYVQLTEQYLLPERRRHGVLVITNHRSARFWVSDDHRTRIGFAELIALLQAEASSITQNSAGPARVEVRGIDAGYPDSEDPSSSHAGEGPA